MRSHFVNKIVKISKYAKQLLVFYFDKKFNIMNIDRAIHYLILAANQNHKEVQLLLDSIYYAKTLDQVKAFFSIMSMHSLKQAK